VSYGFPRRKRRTGRFATAAFPDRPFAVGFLTTVFAAVFLGVATLFTADVGLCACWKTHGAHRPSRSALSSLATSSGPTSSLPQYVVVAKLFVLGTCHSAEAAATRLSRRTH
jgi:hypothetical protein